MESGVEADGGAAQRACIGSEGCGEAGGIKICALGRGAVYDAEVAKVSEH